MIDASQKTLEDFLNGFSNVAFFLDNRRIIQAANTPAQATFGQDTTGQNFVAIMRRPEVLRLIDNCLTHGQQAQELLALDGVLRGDFQVTASRVGESEVVISFADQTDIRAAERMRSDFVANVSHELRSPLTSISGFIETLQGPAKDDEQAQIRFLDLMKQEAGRMDRLIGDLLSLSKVESDAHVLPRSSVELGDLVTRVIAVLTQPAAKAGVVVEVKTQDVLFQVQGDEDQLIQVFRNLIENAVKYGGDGGIVSVSLDQLPNAPGIRGKAVSVAVSDQGEGFARRHLPRLTERFYRVDDGRAREKGGTGLGLAIVKHIVQRHRGRLLIDSIEGKGSTFTVLLPEAD